MLLRIALALGAALCLLAAVAPDARDSLTNSLGMELVRIPAGEFEMGSPPDEPGRLDNEGPQHTVHITRDFYLSRYETTVSDFRVFVEATGYVTEAERDIEGGFGINFETGQVVQMSGIDWREPGFPDLVQSERYPIVLISWNDAEAFCRWLSEKEARRYRLPTEAEWEYAARGGASTPWWTGSDPRALGGAANLADALLQERMPAAKHGEAWDDGYAFTAPVGAYRANPFGLHDMHGNVWEWVADWHDDAAYADSPVRDPQGPDSGRFRGIRGGGWFNPASQNRSAQRIYFEPTFRYCLLSGFRVALDL